MQTRPLNPTEIRLLEWLLGALDQAAADALRMQLAHLVVPTRLNNNSCCATLPLMPDATLQAQLSSGRLVNAPKFNAPQIIEAGYTAHPSDSLRLHIAAAGLMIHLEIAHTGPTGPMEWPTPAQLDVPQWWEVEADDMADGEGSRRPD